MKTTRLSHTVLLAALFLDHQYGSAQNMKGVEAEELHINLLSDVKLKSASDGESVPSTGTGQLGVSFRKEYFYGSVLFNVANRNEEVSVPDTGEVVAFANNLLIPDNSGEGLSNFRLDLGVKSLARVDQDWRDVHFISPHRFGFSGFWQMNNTTWTKDTVTTPLFISSFGLNATYALLSAKILNEKEDNVHISLSLGFEARRIGGDYSLKKNEKIRDHFLGTTSYAFNSVVLGVMLEVGDFYGRIQHYNFGEKEQINGFSGHQALITVGMNVEFNVKAEAKEPNAVMEKLGTDRKKKREDKKKVP